MRLAIVTTHPIQYYAPVFQLLHQRKHIDIQVFYTWGEASMAKFDPGFNKKITWDIPLLDGYPYTWVKNTSTDPGTHHFSGIINPDLIEQLNNWAPDALLIYGWGFKSHLKVMRYFKGKKPVIFRGDSNLLDETGGLKATLRAMALKWIYHHVDYAVYVGSNNKAYYKKFGLKENQLCFAPHAIDNGRFAIVATDEHPSLRARLNIPADNTLILFAGKFEEKKAPLELLKAFLSLNRHDVHLLFVGNGPLEHQLKTDAAGNGNIHFTGFQNQLQMPEVYQACDIFCLPSKGPGETWGLAVNEAMAAGKAVLVSDKVGSAIDLVKPGENGAIFIADNVNDLADKLNKLIASGKSDLAEMGQASKKIIENWSLINQVKAIERLVNNE